MAEPAVAWMWRVLWLNMTQQTRDSVLLIDKHLVFYFDFNPYLILVLILMCWPCRCPRFIGSESSLPIVLIVFPHLPPTFLTHCHEFKPPRMRDCRCKEVVIPLHRRIEPVVLAGIARRVHGPISRFNASRRIAWNPIPSL